MLKTLYHILKNMGFKYLFFRLWYEFKRKSGILKRSFPSKYPFQHFISYQQWKQSAYPFLFNSRSDLVDFSISEEAKQKLESEYNNFKKDKYLYFSNLYFNVPKNQWLKNPDSGFTYSLTHWTQISDYQPNNGDIKFVWERARFTFLQTIIRYDYHFKQDNSKMVFEQIESFIDENPINLGPNYVCSQEISLRCINWSFALFFYRNSEHLTETLFHKIINSIYRQTLHVQLNIAFSTIAVRNNHALTESLWLYMAGSIFPFFPKSENLKSKGKELFEKELLYQFEPDGSYIQQSFNYQRVAMQLFLLGSRIAKLQKESFSVRTNLKMQSSVEFLASFVQPENGYLPNYGANDGALFFKLNSSDFRDYRAQINAFYFNFHNKTLFENPDTNEDIFWFFNTNIFPKEPRILHSISFKNGGYFLLKNSLSTAFIRCNKNTHRPSHADNLHLDLWFQGKNILRDGGSYKYIANEDEINFFFGSASHNTVMIEGSNQMVKGKRFIWHNWSQAIFAKTYSETDFEVFEGEISAFKCISNGIKHYRKVKQSKTLPYWEIEDILTGTGSRYAQQIWNISPDFESLGFSIQAFDVDNVELKPIFKNAWYSGYYGSKEQSEQIVFETNKKQFKTIIKKN